MKKHYRHENNCLNCGTHLSGKFCHNCGQENLEIKESFGHMVNHAVSDYFHFDHQFFHTLKPLFFSPGKLTNEYMAGKRAQYLHPVKMYIFISLVFFFLYFKHNSAEEHAVEHKKATTEHKKEAIDSVSKVIEKSPLLSKEQKMHINDAIKAEKDSTSHKKRVINDETFADDSGIKDAVTMINGEELDAHETYEEYLAKQQKLPEDERDNFWERFARKKAIAWNKNGTSGKQVKEAVMDAFKHNIPKLMFFMLPIYAFILKLGFSKNKKYYVEHLIFSIHLHCFFFISLTIVMLLKMCLPQSWEAVGEWIELLALIAITFYVYKALKALYQRSRLRTFTKMIGTGAVYSLSIIIGFVILLGIIISVSV